MQTGSKDKTINALPLQWAFKENTSLNEPPRKNNGKTKG